MCICHRFGDIPFLLSNSGLLELELAATLSDWNENVRGNDEILLRIMRAMTILRKMKSWDGSPNWSKGAEKGRASMTDTGGWCFGGFVSVCLFL